MRGSVLTYEGLYDSYDTRSIHERGRDGYTGETPFIAPGIIVTGHGYRGWKGKVQDMWWGGGSHGDTYPDDGSKQFAQFGQLIVPWDGGPIATY